MILRALGERCPERTFDTGIETVKLFSPTELTARVGAAFRTRAGAAPFVLGALAIDYVRRRVTVLATPFAIAPLRTARGLAPRRHRAMHLRRAKCAHRRSPPPGPRRAQPRALCAGRRPQSLPRFPPHRRRRGLRRPWCWPEGGREVRGPGQSRASSAPARQPSRVRTRVRACAAARRRGRVRGLSNRIPVRRSDRCAPRERMA